MSELKGRSEGESFVEAFTIDFRRLLQKGIENIGIVLAVILVFVAHGAYKALQVNPVFTSMATLEVIVDDTDTVEGVMQRGGRASFRSMNPRSMNTLAQSVQQYEFLQEVVENRKLHLDPIVIGSRTNQLSVEDCTVMLRGAVDANIRLNTMFLDVFATHRDRAVAELFANAVALEFVEYRKRMRGDAAKDVSAILVVEAQELKDRIKQADLEIQRYKREYQTVSFEDQQSNVLKEVTGLNTQVLSAKTERLQLGADLAEIKKIGEDVERLEQLPSIQQDEAYSDAKTKLADQEALVATLSRTFKPKYPKLIVANRELEDQRLALKEAVLDAAGRIDGAHKNAQAREEGLVTALREAEKRALDLQDLAIQYNSLVRDKKTDEAIYDSVLLRIKEAGISADNKGSQVQLAETASIPGAPSGGSRSMRVVVSTVFGCVLAFAIVLFFYFSDSSLKTVDETESYLRLPVLGAVPKEKGKSSERFRRVVAESPQSKVSEAFRSLRTAVQLLGPESDRKIVAFTSADPGEGKSFTCSNYAISEALQGKKTLLVDLDLRRPTVNVSWDLPADGKGVTNFLLAEAGLEDLVQASSVDGLDLLAAGPLVPNPAEQLAGPRTELLIAEAAKKYDRVVIDTAPVNAVSDTLTLLRFVQVAAVVVRAGKTPRKGIRRCVEMIERAGVKLAGSVLNFLPTRAGLGYYYYYQPKDGYTSKGVYGVENRAT